MSIAAMQSDVFQEESLKAQVQSIIQSKIQGIDRLRQEKLHFLSQQNLLDEGVHLLDEIYYFIERTTHALYLLHILKGQVTMHNAHLILDLLSDDKYLTISEERLDFTLVGMSEARTA